MRPGPVPAEGHKPPRTAEGPTGAPSGLGLMAFGRGGPVGPLSLSDIESLKDLASPCGAPIVSQEGQELFLYPMDTMARDVIGIMQQLHLERAHIVGSSLGAEVGLSMAANYPEKVISLVCDGALSSEYGPYSAWEGSQVEFEEHVTQQLSMGPQVRPTGSPSTSATTGRSQTGSGPGVMRFDHHSSGRSCSSASVLPNASGESASARRRNSLKVLHS